MLMGRGKVQDRGQNGGVVCFVDQHLPHAVGLGQLQPGRHWTCRRLGRDKEGGSLPKHTQTHTLSHLHTQSLGGIFANQHMTS